MSYVKCIIVVIVSYHPPPALNKVLGIKLSQLSQLYLFMSVYDQQVYRPQVEWNESNFSISLDKYIIFIVGSGYSAEAPQRGVPTF